MSEPTLPPEFDRLKKEVGDWEGAITITPGPGAPPQESRGTLSARLISGGRWLIMDFKNHTTGFEGHGIYGYNPASKRYMGTWVDDMRTQIYVGEGAWDESSRTMTYSWTATLPDGRVMNWKESSEATAENERIFRVVFPSPDGAEFEMMRVVYRR